MIVAVRSKFELLVVLIASYINVLMISETKINEPFSNFTILHGRFFFTEVEKHMNRNSWFQQAFKKGVRKNSQISKKNTCVEVFF